MSKFNEILNSSDASDALLGEQIDKINSLMPRSVRLYRNDITSGGTGYLKVGSINCGENDVVRAQAKYYTGQPVGIRFVNPADGGVLAVKESDTDYKSLIVEFFVDYTAHIPVIDVEIKTKIDAPRLCAICKIIP